jgi:Ca2+-binding RTX toxin-like protein
MRGVARQPRRLAVLITVAVGIAVPSSAQGATLANGVYTAEPGEDNIVQVIYEPGLGTYRFLHGTIPTDGDGPGGCSVSAAGARCPAASVSKIVVNTGDGRDNVSIGPLGYIPLAPLMPSISDANQVRIPAEVHGGDGPDTISGGWGADVLDGGAGTDLVAGFEGSFFGATPESEIQATDQLICGTGGDFDGGNGFGPEDMAQADEGDQVGIDCESVQTFVRCPRKGSDCTGVARIEALVETGDSASQSGKRSNRKRGLLVGSGKFRVGSGGTGMASTRLKPGRVRRALRGRSSVPARSTAVAKRKKKDKVLARTRLRLTSSP